MQSKLEELLGQSQQQINRFCSSEFFSILIIFFFSYVLSFNKLYLIIFKLHSWVVLVFEKKQLK
jgi:hypothetical protein